MDSQELRKLVGRNLKRLRTRKKFSQMTLAAKVELTHNFINEIENGHKWVSPETLVKLARALEAAPHEFFLFADTAPGDLASEIVKDLLSELTSLTEEFNLKIREMQGYYTPDTDLPPKNPPEISKI